MKLLLSILGLCVAPFLGAFKAIREEINRPYLVYPSVSLRIKDSIRIYFAPLTGAVRETWAKLRQVIDQFD